MSRPSSAAAASPLDEIAQDDQEIRKQFDSVRREVFEIEKLKYRRLQDAAHRKLGILKPEEQQQKNNKSGSGKDKQQQQQPQEAKNPYSVFTNWRKVLVLAFFILVLQWRRLVNMWDLTFGSAAEEGTCPLAAAANQK